jgi:xylulokinase
VTRAGAVIGLDVGTSAVKGLLSDGTRSLATHRRSFPLGLAAGGRATVDARDVLAAARAVVAALVADARASGVEVVGLCAGGSGDEAVFVDRAGEPVAPVAMALDTGDAGAVDAVLRRAGSAFHRTGLPPASAYPLLRYAALASERPALARRVRRILAWPEYLADRLGVPAAAEPSLAGRSGAYDVDAGRWDSELLAAAGIDESRLPPLVPTGAVLGVVPAEVAHALGLGPSVAVVAGGFDQAMATAGAGIDRPGIAHLGTGSWEAVSVLAAAPIAAASRASLVEAGFSVGPAAWSDPGEDRGDPPALVGSSAPGAVALGWIGRVAGAPPRAAVAQALRLAASAPDEPSRLTVLPAFAGAFAADAGSRAGAVVAGLDLAAGPELVALAVLESIALRVAEQLDALERAGMPSAEVRVTGGTGRDRRWLQLRADATGRPVRAVVPADAGTVAAVALACVGLGIAPSVGEVVDALVRVGPPIEPRPDRQAALARSAERRAELRRSLAAVPAQPPRQREGPAFA